MSLRRLFGAAFVLLGIAAGLAPSALSVRAVSKVVAGNAPVNGGARDRLDLNAHNSPTLVRNPVDGSNLAVANRIDLPLYSCALHLSFDGGASWEQTAIPVPDGEEPKCYAPDVAFGADGTLYLSFLTLQGVANVPNAVWTAKSTNGGRTLSAPAKALGPLAFQVRIVADPMVAGRIHLSWLQAANTALLAFPEAGYPIRSARSDDGGTTWEQAVRVSDPRRMRVVAPSPAVGADGRMYVAYLDVGDDALDYHGGHQGRGGEPYPGRWELVLARSSDDGATWRESVVEKRLVPTQRFVVFIPPFPSVAVDAQRNRVYAGFHDGRLGDADVRVWASGDSGMTWSQPKRVNDTARHDGSTQYLPKLAVAPDGRLDVVYYDRREDRRDVRNEVSLQSSFDGARSFTKRLRLSDRPFDSRLGFGAERGLPDLGSRLGLIAADDRSLAVWTDTRTGTEVSNKQDIVRGLAHVSGARELPAGVASALRIGGASVGVVGLVMVLRRRAPAVGTAVAT